jgi:Leucine-rich repeat (LRR) protein
MIPQPTQPPASPAHYPASHDQISPEQLQSWVASRKRKWARLKSVFLAALVVGLSAIGLIWCFFHEQLIAVAHVQSLGFIVDWELNRDNFWTRGTTAVSMHRGRGPIIRVDRRDLESICALPHVESLELGNVRLQDDDIAFISKLPELTFLGLDRVRMPGTNMLETQPMNRLTDRSLENVRGLKKLVTLNLKNNNITDDGLSSLQGLQSLKDLDLMNNPITDAGLTKLSSLQSLETLDLEGTLVTAKGLDALKGLKNLKYIRVEKTAITRENVIPFLTERPGVVIDRDDTEEPRK